MKWAPAAVALVVLAAGAAYGESALDVVRRADRVRAPAEPFTVELSLLTGGGAAPTPAARLKLYVKDRARSLARFVDPGTERGKALLMVGGNLWVYLPSTDRPLRISPLQRLVGEVSHADVLRVNFEGDYTPELDGEETVDGAVCTRLWLRGTADGVTYARIRYWVARETFRPVRAEFYAVSGLLLKTARFTRYASAVGAERPAEVEITDAVRGDRVSRMVYARYRLERLGEEMFQPTYLRYLK